MFVGVYLGGPDSYTPDDHSPVPEYLGKYLCPKNAELFASFYAKFITIT
jgi:hypothetical protein